MSRRHKESLRSLTVDERQWLARLARSGSEPAEQVAWAKALLAVTAGHSYIAAARLAGRHSGDAVSHLVTRFNREGKGALARRPGQGAKPTYSALERAKIIAQAGRLPEPARDGTGHWSLMTLRRALREAPDGLPRVSTYTIRTVLHEARVRWVKSRTWCTTGQAVRRRKAGLVTVTDPDAEAKKI
jgi:hypothetical protein